MSTHYSHHFGREAVQGFVEKYGRAAAFCAYSLGIPKVEFYKILLEHICHNQNRWERLKYIIKDIDKHVFGSALEQTLKYDRQKAFNYYAQIGYLWDDCYLDSSNSAQISVDRCSPED